MKTVLLIFLSVAALLVPLRAQSAPEAAGGGTTPPDVTGAVPVPHDIMAWSTSHKPSATPPPAEIAQAIDNFFSVMKAGKYADAYETFLAGTRLGAQKEKMSAMVERTGEAFGLYGGMNDYELYDNYPIGSNVLVLTYLSRQEVQPLRWRFIYYRPDKKWKLVNMGLGDFLLDLLN